MYKVPSGLAIRHLAKWHCHRVPHVFTEVQEAGWGESLHMNYSNLV
jgi:hypothetical protein